MPGIAAAYGSLDRAQSALGLTAAAGGFARALDALSGLRLIDTVAGVVGVERISGQLAKYAVKLALHGDQASLHAAQAMVELMRSRVPRDTGLLLNGIGDRRAGGLYVVEATADHAGYDYALEVEAGLHAGGLHADADFFADTTGRGGRPVRHPGVPLLFAVCAPCQPFTTLSRRTMSPERLAKREKDRNLLQCAAGLIERYRPELVLSENVAGIRDRRYGGIWDGFATELSRIGYATGARLVCVSAFGIAQYRKRSILIGARADVVASTMIDESDGRIVVPDRDVASPAKSVAEVIGHLPKLGAGEVHAEVPNHRTRSLSALNIERMKFARPGETNRYMADTASGDLSLECHRRVNARLAQRCFNDVYTRMSADRPSPTITTKCHSISNGRFGHYDMDQLRGISLREAAALQSFPDDYVFHPVERIEPIARMIGNAVPPKLAQFFAGYLVRLIAGAARS